MIETKFYYFQVLGISQKLTMFPARLPCHALLKSIIHRSQDPIKIFKNLLVKPELGRSFLSMENRSWAKGQHFTLGNKTMTPPRCLWPRNFYLNTFEWPRGPQNAGLGHKSHMSFKIMNKPRLSFTTEILWYYNGRSH